MFTRTITQQPVTMEPAVSPLLSTEASALPMELWDLIFRFLSVPNSAQLSLTCRTFHCIGEGSSLWKFYCCRDFSIESAKKGHYSRSDTFDWKSHYRLLLVPFPGESTTFEISQATPSIFSESILERCLASPPNSNEWIIDYTGSFVIRQMSFTSVSDTSLIQEVTFLGMEDGTIAITLEVSRESKDKFETYFKSLGIKDEGFRLLNHFCVENLNNRKKVFTVLEEYCVFPKGYYLTFLENLANSSYWTTVTPLQEEEIEEIESRIIPAKCIIVDSFFGVVKLGVILAPATSMRDRFAKALGRCLIAHEDFLKPIIKGAITTFYQIFPPEIKSLISNK